jgi:hypothetical protein
VVLEQGVLGQVVRQSHRRSAHARTHVDDTQAPGQEPPIDQIIEDVLHCGVVVREVIDRIAQRRSFVVGNLSAREVLLFQPADRLPEFVAGFAGRPVGPVALDQAVLQPAGVPIGEALDGVREPLEWLLRDGLEGPVGTLDQSEVRGFFSESLPDGCGVWPSLDVLVDLRGIDRPHLAEVLRVRDDRLALFGGHSSASGAEWLPALSPASRYSRSNRSASASAIRAAASATSSAPSKAS